MTYAIIRSAHPLDLIWNDLPDTANEAWDEVEATAPGCPQEEIDALVDKASAITLAMLAVPARNAGDVASKLDTLFDRNGEQRVRFNLSTLTEELSLVIHDGLTAGRALTATEGEP